MKFKFYKILLTAALFAASANFIFAQTEINNGIELYQQGAYQEAVKILKQKTKTDSGDAESWYVLGSSYLRLNKTKDAKKAFEKVIKLRPDDAQGYVGLGYAQLAARKFYDARSAAQKAVELEARNADAHYILGVFYLLVGSYSAAYERAGNTIKINPQFADAYLLKSEAITSSIGEMSRIIVKSPTQKADLLKEAVESMEKFISLAGSKQNLANQREKLESLRFFADYYAKPENYPRDTLTPKPPTDDNSTTIKITTKPRAEYTDSARHARVSGVVRVLVEFSTDGKIKHLLIINGLGWGLNEEALKAVRKIKFEPATKDGKPVSVVKIIEYTFSIY